MRTSGGGMAGGGELTGNDYVSIPSIGADGSIDGITVLHGASAGLIEWAGAGASLLRPRISFDGEPVVPDARSWRRLDRWVPTFTVRLPDDSTVTGTICAPGGYPPARGFFFRIEVESKRRAPAELRVDLDIDWSHSRIWIASGRPLPGANRLTVADRTITLETDDGRGPALAITGSHVSSVVGSEGDGRDAPNGSRLHATISQTVRVASNGRAAVVFHIGAGRERDGAMAAAAGLARHGADHWLRQARLELSHILRPAQDHRWAETLNRNLIFNRYFAVGRAIDDDRVYLLRSRSTRCPAPALLNEREALLWTLPALIISDPGLAREALFRMFEMTSERSGEFIRYADGGAFDPAFVLDQFLLYAWAVDYYTEVTGDVSVLDDPLTRQVILETDSAAYIRLHPQHLLATTELLPSGDVADYPYATVANALLWKLADSLSRLLPAQHPDDPPPRFLDAGAEIAAAIWQHCVTDVQGSLVLASSADLEGQAAVYDDPAMSIALLPFFGFCTGDDPIWRATMEFLRSEDYPLWRTGTVSGLAARTDNSRARTAALCADLLTYRAQETLQQLLELELPDGIAAGTYDVDSREMFEPHYATLAGFLAWTLVRAAEPKDELASRRKRRR